MINFFRIVQNIDFVFVNIHIDTNPFQNFRQDRSFLFIKEKIQENKEQTYKCGPDFQSGGG